VSKQALRNLLRWAGLAIAIIGFVIGRVARTASGFQTGRVLVWVGLGMIVAGIVVRMFIREP
jgi:VIT1/CCC1 family predicted Fe2+/Mn2+ transporter